MNDEFKRNSGMVGGYVQGMVSGPDEAYMMFLHQNDLKRSTEAIGTWLEAGWRLSSITEDKAIFIRDFVWHDCSEPTPIGTKIWVSDGATIWMLKGNGKSLAGEWLFWTPAIVPPLPGDKHARSTTSVISDSLHKAVSHLQSWNEAIDAAMNIAASGKRFTFRRHGERPKTAGEILAELQVLKNKFNMSPTPPSPAPPRG